MNRVKNTVAVAGIGQTPFYKRGAAPTSERRMLLEAIVAACEDAGLHPSEVDGFVSYSHDRNNGTLLTHELGTKELRWSGEVAGGGGGGIPAAIGAAAGAIATGQANVVVVFRAISEREMGRFNVAIEADHANPHYTAHGVLVAAQMMAMRTQRMLYEFGVPRSTLEALVLTDYHHARNNPRATGYGNTLDAETYRNSRMIAEPYRLFDCSRENDGAAAAVIVSADRARDLKQAPVHVLGVAQGNPPGGGDTWDNFSEYATGGFTSIARNLWAQTGLGPSDIDVLQVYENFSGLGVAAIMDHGFCTPENIAEVVSFENMIAQGGKLPVNTSGGCLAEGFIHGMEVLLESVRQLRGQSPNPVAGAETCLMTGGPGSTYLSSAVFGTEATL